MWTNLDPRLRGDERGYNLAGALFRPGFVGRLDRLKTDEGGLSDGSQLEGSGPRQRDRIVFG